MKKYGSAFDLLEDPIQSKLLQKKSKLMNSIIDRLTELGVNQSKAAELMQVTQPRVSDLYQGKISKFTLDILFKMNERLGLVT